MPTFEIDFKFTMFCRTHVTANSSEEAKAKIKIGYNGDDWDGWSPDQIYDSTENEIIEIKQLEEPLEYFVEYECTPHARILIEADSMEEAKKLFSQMDHENGDEYDCEEYVVRNVTPLAPRLRGVK